MNLIVQSSVYYIHDKSLYNNIKNKIFEKNKVNFTFQASSQTIVEIVIIKQI
jgi:hypothetical protein